MVSKPTTACSSRKVTDIGVAESVQIPGHPSRPHRAPSAGRGSRWRILLAPEQFGAHHYVLRDALKSHRSLGIGPMATQPLLVSGQRAGAPVDQIEVFPFRERRSASRSRRSPALPSGDLPHGSPRSTSDRSAEGGSLVGDLFYIMEHHLKSPFRRHARRTCSARRHRAPAPGCIPQDLLTHRRTSSAAAIWFRVAPDLTGAVMILHVPRTYHRAPLRQIPRAGRER